MYKNLLYYRVTYTVSIYTIAVKNIQKTGLKILINNMENNKGSTLWRGAVNTLCKQNTAGVTMDHLEWLISMNTVCI